MDSYSENNKEDTDSENKIKELQKELENITKNQKDFIKTIGRKSTIILGVIAFLAVAIAFIIADDISEENQTIMTKGFPLENMRSGYFIENLKGEKVSTWVSWKIENDDPFHIHVMMSPEATAERIDTINEVVFSTDTINVNGQTYYKGWRGAMESVVTDTLFSIPIHYHSVITDVGTGQILIKLTNKKSPDGYSGYTLSQVDESNNQILKSTVTIYGVNDLTLQELSIIVRHELGHAFGLAHSDNPDDLMYYIITSEQPYISPCTVEAIIGLYDGSKKSTITCTQ